MKYERGVIWYNKTATDDRVWCVQREGEPTVRARIVTFSNGHSHFLAEGHALLQPGGPRGVIVADNIKTFDEVPCVP